MGRRGPRTAPAKLKVLHGEKNADRIPTDEPEPSPEAPELAGDVSDEVRAVWTRTVRELQVMGLAYAADQDIIRAYCEAVVTHERACAVLARTGVLVKGLHGNYVRNPALQVQRDAAASLRGFAQELGLTPSARTQLGLDRDRPSPMGAERLLS